MSYGFHMILYRCIWFHMVFYMNIIVIIIIIIISILFIIFLIIIVIFIIIILEVGSSFLKCPISFEYSSFPDSEIRHFEHLIKNA